MNCNQSQNISAFKTQRNFNSTSLCSQRTDPIFVSKESISSFSFGSSFLSRTIIFSERTSFYFVSMKMVPCQIWPFARQIVCNRYSNKWKSRLFFSFENFGTLSDRDTLIKTSDELTKSLTANQKREYQEQTRESSRHMNEDQQHNCILPGREYRCLS